MPNLKVISLLGNTHESILLIWLLINHNLWLRFRLNPHNNKNLKKANGSEE